MADKTAKDIDREERLIESLDRLTLAANRVADAIEEMHQPPAGWVRLVQSLCQGLRQIPSSIRVRPY